ncbi:MAG TPA: aminotransferase class III-fold pyridoxal phosphate-dependent enzyme [Dongiaceae bacterium]|nr:aminotransferase class III-fold pyridoxal phosphate-dependent enzyme [Dongiaceae bacterium]
MATAPKLDFEYGTRGKRALHASHRQRQRAEKSLPLGVSDTYRYWGDEATIYVKRGKGAFLWDLDGNRYVDFRLGWGPIILGYGDERVDRAARHGIEFGGVSALATELEASVAELMIEMVPSLEKVRFANSGSEAVATALRVARGYSGRDGFVMVEGAFHGMFDPVLWRTQMETWDPASGAAPDVVPFGKGIPKAHRDLVGVVPLNDADALEDLFKREGDKIGAFLMEPILGNCCSIASRQRYLHDVRLLCDKYDVVLIFDEVKTGFRVARGGAQELYGIRPDLSTFAKSMGNGYPIAALGGPAEIMKVISGFDGVLHGGTFTGHPVSLAAAEETLRILRDTDALQTVESWGRGLQAELGAVFRAAELPHVFTGHPSMFGIMFREGLPESYRDWATSDHDLYDALARALPDYGLLPEPDSREPWFVCEAHAALDPADIAGTVAEVIATLRR